MENFVKLLKPKQISLQLQLLKNIPERNPETTLRVIFTENSVKTKHKELTEQSIRSRKILKTLFTDYK